MIKTHASSIIVQFHHDSVYGKELLSEKSKYVVIQIEPVEHEKYDFIAEIIKKELYNI